MTIEPQTPVAYLGFISLWKDRAGQSIENMSRRVGGVTDWRECARIVAM